MRRLAIIHNVLQMFRFTLDKHSIVLIINLEPRYSHIAPAKIAQSDSVRMHPLGALMIVRVNMSKSSGSQLKNPSCT